MPALRVILSPAAPGAWHMALDEALVERCNADLDNAAPTLRLYHFAPPCLSLGSFQPFADVRLEACTHDGIEVVRRPTGGRAVLHDRDLTYAVVGPADGPLFAGGVRRSARRIGGILAAAVARLGADASPVPGPSGRRAFAPSQRCGTNGGPLPAIGATCQTEGRHDPPTEAQQRPPAAEGDRAARGRPPDCFAVAGAYEVAVMGRKLIGSAQLRRGGAALQHGTVRLHADAGHAAPYLRAAPDAVRCAPPVSLSECTGRAVGFGEVVEALVTAFADALDTRVQRDEIAASEQQHAAKLASRYASRAWTVRR